jgi:hypothetical protein
MIKITPIRTTGGVDAVQAAAQADGHVLIAPSHAILKDGKILGSLSMIPTAMIWMHTKDAKARDTLELQSFIENHFSANGGTAMCLPCTKESPYFSVLSKLGYVDIGQFNLFVKGL